MKFDLKLEDINYIKILYKDRYNFTHYLKAAIQKLDEKFIYAGVKSEKRIIIDAPQEVGLSFICDNGLYKTKTMLPFVQYNTEEEYLFFSLVTPQEVEYQQNREYFRIEMQEKAEVSFTLNDETITISALMHDISANGVRIILNGPMKFPEEVKLRLFFPSKEIETTAKYIRSDDDDNLYKASFYYTNISTQDLDFISRMCLKKQLENRRNYLNQ